MLPESPQASANKPDDNLCEISRQMKARIHDSVLYCWDCYPCQRLMVDALTGTERKATLAVTLHMSCPLTNLSMDMHVYRENLEESVMHSPWMINPRAAKAIREYIEIGCKKSCPYLPRMDVRTGHIENLPWTERPVPSIADDLKAALLTGSWDMPPETNKE